jgi:hypothetical protein
MCMSQLWRWGKSTLTSQTVSPPPLSVETHIIAVSYDYDSHTVNNTPMKNRGDNEMVRAYDLLVHALIDRFIKPIPQCMDNEAFIALKSYLTRQGIDFQLAPPHIHRSSAAEHTIQTFKNEFIAEICSCDPNSPLKLWDKLIPQVTITLNLLRKSWINPCMSAYAQLNGHYDFNRAPMAPPGTSIISHEKLDQHASWAPHNVDGYYLALAVDHYRCYQVYITKTQAIRVAENMGFFPYNSKTAMT